jgi:dUTP pyrophosphatase
MFIKFKKFSGDTMLGRGHAADAGVDVFLNKELIFYPHQPVKVPLGFGMLIPYNFVGYVEPRTSVSCLGLNIAHCPIDAMYKGEIHAIVTNMTDTTVKFPANKALCQVVVQPFMSTELIHAEDWDDFIGIKRETCGFGSTDKPAETPVNEQLKLDFGEDNGEN